MGIETQYFRKLAFYFTARMISLNLNNLGLILIFYDVFIDASKTANGGVKIDFDILLHVSIL